jgi:hypothetical protein
LPGEIGGRGQGDSPLKGEGCKSALLCGLDTGDDQPLDPLDTEKDPSLLHDAPDIGDTPLGELGAAPSPLDALNDELFRHPSLSVLEGRAPSTAGGK